ncbi:Hypothetical predicted protein, partial [Marmota monax]
MVISTNRNARRTTGPREGLSALWAGRGQNAQYSCHFVSFPLELWFVKCPWLRPCVFLEDQLTQAPFSAAFLELGLRRLLHGVGLKGASALNP